MGLHTLTQFQKRTVIPPLESSCSSPGVVTVQLGIACSNYKVQVANLNPPVLVGAVSRRRLTVYDSTQAPVRQQELAPTKNIEIPEH